MTFPVASPAAQPRFTQAAFNGVNSDQPGATPNPADIARAQSFLGMSQGGLAGLFGGQQGPKTPEELTKTLGEQLRKLEPPELGEQIAKQLGPLLKNANPNDPAFMAQLGKALEPVEKAARSQLEKQGVKLPPNASLDDMKQAALQQMAQGPGGPERAGGFKDASLFDILKGLKDPQMPPPPKPNGPGEPQTGAPEGGPQGPDAPRPGAPQTPGGAPGTPRAGGPGGPAGDQMEQGPGHPSPEREAAPQTRPRPQRPHAGKHHRHGVRAQRPHHHERSAAPQEQRAPKVEETEPVAGPPAQRRVEPGPGAADDAVVSGAPANRPLTPARPAAADAIPERSTSGPPTNSRFNYVVNQIVTNQGNRADWVTELKGSSPSQVGLLRAAGDKQPVYRDLANEVFGAEPPRPAAQ